MSINIPSSDIFLRSCRTYSKSPTSPPSTYVFPTGTSRVWRGVEFSISTTLLFFKINVFLSSTPTDSAKRRDRKSTRLNSSHVKISYAVFCLKKKKHSQSPIHIFTTNQQ